jgi:hypothetical protein
MYRIHPRLHLVEAVLAGAAMGLVNALLWWLVLGDVLPLWGVGLIAVPSAFVLMRLAVAGWQGLAARRRHGRRAHAQPRPTVRKAA